MTRKRTEPPRRCGAGFVLRRLMAGVCATVLGACAVERVKPGPTSDLDILGPRLDVVTAGLDGSWKTTGDALDAVSIERYEGVPGLRLRALDDGYAVVRRLDARLIVSPYLTWSWRAETHAAALHPVRIVAGFKSSPDAGDPGYEWLDDDLPDHDRVIAVAWGDSALKRGTFRLSTDPDAGPPVYIVRGGRESHGVWWFEAIDLQRLYAQAWPEDDVSRVRVAFLGFAAEPGAAEAAMTVSGLRLSR